MVNSIPSFDLSVNFIDQGFFSSRLKIQDDKTIAIYQGIVGRFLSFIGKAQKVSYQENNETKFMYVNLNSIKNHHLSSEEGQKLFTYNKISKFAQVFLETSNTKKANENQVTTDKVSPDKTTNQVSDEITSPTNTDATTKLNFNEDPINDTTLQIDFAKDAFIHWWLKDDNKLGEGDFQKEADKIQELIKNSKLPTKELTLHSYPFRFGFKFFYGEIDGNPIPISFNEGFILNWSNNQKVENNWWPIKDAKNNYYLPKTTIITENIGGGSNNTFSYLSDELSTAKWDVSSPAYKMLKQLMPYAKLIHKNDPELYAEIKELFPQYPDNP